MKKLTLLLLALLLAFGLARAEGLNPYDEIPVEASENTLYYADVDFGGGAALLRFKAHSEGQLIYGRFFVLLSV